MVNPDRPWPRPETPRAPLDATSSETLELWAAQPEWDMRSLEEFAADGGRPEGPPNRTEGGPPVWAALFAFVWGLPYLAFRFFRRILVALKGDPNRGRFYELPPPVPRFVPAPPPPSTPMITGHLRDTFRGRPIDTGGALIFPFPKNAEPTTSMLPRAPIGGTGETRRNRGTDSTGPR